MLEDSLKYAIAFLRNCMDEINWYRVQSIIDFYGPDIKHLSATIEYLEKQIAAGVPLHDLEDRADLHENLNENRKKYIREDTGLSLYDGS